MPNEFFEQTLLELTRKGDIEKVKLLKNLHKKILPSQFERIKNNDKGVMKDLFMPNWVSWELLRAWADNYSVPGKGTECALCSAKSENGIKFNEKFICEECFVRIKQLE